MLRWIRRCFFVVGGVAALIGVARFCHHATKGFRLSKITSNFHQESAPLAASEEDRTFVNTLFQQKFRYLSRGFQSFVFASEDGLYVLKLFNNRHQTKGQIFSFLSRIPLFGTLAKTGVTHHEDKCAQTFASYRIAFDAMKDKTGLVYLHLSPTTNLNPVLTLIDPLNICHQIDPNTTGFLIQKRATLVYPALTEYVISHDVDGAKKALSSLIALFFWKWDHGIADNDPLIRTNYGFIDGRAIQIDVGPLSKDSSTLGSAHQRSQIGRITASLKGWLHENAPELVAFLDEEIEHRLSSPQ